ncbi:hypothetical protein BJV85_001247 [Clostridium acetobutylicum]|uniref:Uncharacterized protein n=1 Tax=Clostridium acetobutylicum (strain ATCC 824 / DSM 792 / JCM 1419 / IAM 19013 / LMG 5710 / NBRC 13948 / NRRL B-527 / VKM B-1787 / 2291 / W) TaxID=272562 RepID=Q97FT4_CLOAB|nr:MULTISPECIES: hypothetical protein [Clostridium]AAK80590.1 Hypothetical protein CA_C2643 [Clostridium acetobutylicum ATCC 824]ADZ21689.1 Conserved hypothetical protein [Clostridium acetobutylicum EA 2018]AEI32481.1 hypothetical protein SMB_G2678 [Clostridium acetobutylicum DSM 1731]AWV78993.1 hypothetical protein DK921_02540 [Clostridium acetobutylicum]MBC2395047.1 hypothetical protein [Clostridium acetobutylicum]
MAKPSIFSSDYEKQQRKRKQRRNISIFLLICVIFLVLVYLGFKTNLKNVKVPKLSASSNVSSKTPSKKSGGTIVKDSKKTSSKNSKAQDESLKVNLPDGKQVSLVCGENNNQRIVKSVDLSGLNGEYNISPSSKNVVIYEKDTQNMFFIDASGVVQDITYKAYTSGSGTTFNKDSILSSNPGYIWGVSPKFVDDNTIVYISQLPWFDNRQSKYVWKFSITDKSYTNSNLTGNDIKMNSLTDKGIEIVIDGNTTYMKADGTTSN